MFTPWGALGPQPRLSNVLCFELHGSVETLIFVTPPVYQALLNPAHEFTRFIFSMHVPTAHEFTRFIFVMHVPTAHEFSRFVFSP